METLYTQPWHSHSMLTLHFLTAATIIVTSCFCNCCSVALAGTILSTFAHPVSLSNDRRWCWGNGQGERMVAFFFFFFVKQAIFRCSKDQWIRSKVKNTIPQTVKSIHYLVRQPSHCVLSIAVCSCGCSY